jgi:hypothetical protein
MFDERVDGIRGAGEAGNGGAAAGGGACDDWRELDRKMRRLASRRSALDAEEAKLLMAAKRAELHKHLGYGSFDEYLERVLGYRPTTGRDKVRVAEALETLPAIATALARGKLSYSAVREITRVAKPHTDEAWADYVVGMTVREIEECVRCKEPGDQPEDRPKPDLAPRVVRMEGRRSSYRKLPSNGPAATPPSSGASTRARPSSRAPRARSLRISGAPSWRATSTAVACPAAHRRGMSTCTTSSTGSTVVRTIRSTSSRSAVCTTTSITTV